MGNNYIYLIPSLIILSLIAIVIYIIYSIYINNVNNNKLINFYK